MSASPVRGDNPNDPHGDARVLVEPISAPARAALVLLHGRGADAEGMMPLGRTVGTDHVRLVAPQASGFTWYPFSFLAPVAQNEPHLTSALALVERVVAGLLEDGFPEDRIALLGFSQGACLALEYAVRHPRRYGAVIGFSGGLIGPPGTSWPIVGSLKETPVFLGCSDRDPHIPLDRFEASGQHVAELGARVDQRVYPGMGHTIVADELRAAKALVEALVAAS